VFQNQNPKELSVLRAQRRIWLSLKVHCPKSISVTILTSNAWEDTRPISCLSYPSEGGTIDPWTLRFLVVREIDCGDWLARGYMPAQQPCDLFYTLVGDLVVP